MRMEKVTQRRRKNMSEKKGEISYSDKKRKKSVTARIASRTSAVMLDDRMHR